MATIKDVAKAAQVSVASVSRYLNAPTLVKIETRKRIADTIKQLNYHPSALAISMRTRQTQNIALIIPSISNMYYIDLHATIRNAMEQHGYSLTLFVTERNQIELCKTFDIVRRNNYAGIVLGFLDEPSINQNLESLNKTIPLVLITCDPSQNTIDNIYLNAMDGIFQTTKHLLSIGKKHIAYAGAEPNNIISIQKYLGYTSALKSAGRIIDPNLVFHGARQHFSTGIEAVSRLFMLPQRPDGIVCSTDDVGIGCVKQLLVNKMSIPDEVAVASFNGISVLRSYEPELTTVVQPVQMMADAAINMLMERIKGKPPRAAKKIEVRGTLSIGNSTVARQD